MSVDIALLLGIIVFTFTAFVREWLPIDVVALVSMSLLLLFDLISPQEAISGFSNPAVITVMMMFVLSEGLVASGLVKKASHRIVRAAGTHRWRGVLLLMALAAVLSAFVNNTAAVAVLMPVAIHLAKHFKFSPSKLLLPLSYVSIFGGTCTLLGTSTNLLVSAMAVEHGLPAFTVFEFFWLGGIFLALGLVYNMLVLMRLLPSRTIISSLTRKYHLGAFLTEIKVPEGSRIVGQTVLDAHVQERFGLTVLEILRGSRKISTDLRHTPLEVGDFLIVRGEVEGFVNFREQYGLLLLSDIKLQDKDFSDEENILMEVQLSPSSKLEGQTLKEINFRKRFGCFVLALNRHAGGFAQTKVAHIELHRWDTLLVFGPRNRVEALAEFDDFIPLQEVGIRLSLPKRWWLSALPIPAVVLLAASGWMSILEAAILGAAFLLVSKRLSIQQAYGSINWTVIFLLATILPMGKAMENTQTASGVSFATVIGQTIADVGGAYGPLAVLAAMILFTTLLTEIISNNAAAVLMVPIAISSANTLGVDSKPMLMGVCFAASLAFLTPMGYQTNTMVYGPGGYRFMDYLKAGAPLKIVFWLIATALVPVFWPF